MHGDLLPGNLLVGNGRLSAVIDFGGLNVGDPACNLQPAWFAGGGAVPQADARSIAYPPELAAAQRRLHASIEAALTAAIADRTGTDPERDLYPQLVASVVVSATQTAQNAAGPSLDSSAQGVNAVIM